MSNLILKLTILFYFILGMQHTYAQDDSPLSVEEELIWRLIVQATPMKVTPSNSGKRRYIGEYNKQSQLVANQGENFANHTKNFEFSLQNDFQDDMSQGITKACSGYAIGSVIDYLLRKNNLHISPNVYISPFMTFAQLSGEKLTCQANLDLTNAQYLPAIKSVRKSLKYLKNNPTCYIESQDHFFSVNDQKSIYVEEFEVIKKKNLTFDLLSNKIKNKLPPILAISTPDTVQTINKYWKKFIVTENNMGHVIVLIGYGEFGGKKYFIVRDSLSGAWRPFKILESDLLAFALEAYVITKIRQVDNVIPEEKSKEDTKLPADQVSVILTYKIGCPNQMPNQNIAYRQVSIEAVNFDDAKKTILKDGSPYLTLKTRGCGKKNSSYDLDRGSIKLIQE